MTSQRDTSTSGALRKVRFVPWWTAPPAIVAEALVAVPDPLLTALRPGSPAPPIAVAASLARSLAPAEDPAPPPPWLLPEQRRSFARALAAVRRYRGAVLADPVGSGKTYVALALAATFNGGRSVACLVPATLMTQWEAVAEGLEIPVALGSHEQVSRGNLPTRTHGLVIVDESHRFRNCHTRRYAHLARWLVGRPALLVTATPIVNHLSDLLHQLLLAVRDDALAIHGVASLRAHLATGCSIPALGQLVMESEAVAPSRPRKTWRASVPAKEERSWARRSIQMVSCLHLSRNESVAALVRGVLLRAAGSSPAALAGALRRYRRLLLNARDARRAGRTMNRAELHRFIAELGDQLVWWEMLPSNGASSDLELTDLEQLEAPIREATAAAQATDSKLHRLRGLLTDGTPTLVFTGSRDTVRYIRERLRDLPLAWCTGDRAGIGPGTLPRRVVLGWFRDGSAAGPGPRHLVVTDVAAEGLDLQRAARVVHYDLPWTPMRLEQREGRAVRLGSRNPEVEVVRFTPPAELERLLRMEETLNRKGKLPAAAGLGPAGHHVWRWRSGLAGLFGEIEAVAGVAAVASSKPGILVGFALYQASNPRVCLSATVGWLEPSNALIEEPEIVSERLLAAAQAKASPLGKERLRDCLLALTAPIRDRLALTRGRRWVSHDSGPAASRLAARLNGFIREAARGRQADRLLRLERATVFAARGHTAGEAMLVERLASLPDRELEAALCRAPTAQPEWDGIEARLTGLIVFGPGVSAQT